MDKTTLEKLHRRGVKFRVLDHNPVATIEDVERVLRIPRRVMVKTLVLCDQSSGRYFVAAFPADRRLSWSKFARVAKVKRNQLKPVEEQDLKDLTGFDLGGIPPFGYQRGFQVIFDKNLLEQSLVYCSAGSPTMSLEINPKTLLQLSGGKADTICSNNKRESM